ncbi:PepSY domain-containing protein [Croceicoccus sp. YJ47]|uniref:PepSY-associated TM helix domain-containing protein n=1 Tax=Croceicoccus sp. YJ47 TaxID=2798724 RepID=UPI001922696B|nr:PepSY-associated TM helix domain-containing protein [Croceicoccus sp. YJ47]QQN74923.1 PepSY domain-containing protein [Croceicoccus sp. YJ47]
MKPHSLLVLHRRLALVFAPFLVLQALTGSMLLYRDDLASLLQPATSSAQEEPAPVSALYAAARRAAPDSAPQRLYLPPAPGSAVVAQMRHGDGTLDYALIDPASGMVLSRGSIWRYPLHAAQELHLRLNAGNFGLLLVCIYGAALAMLAVTGLWHWWPGKRRVLKALKIPDRTPQRMKLRMWHRSSGALMSAALVILSVSGVLTALPNFAAAGPAPVDGLVPTAATIDAAVALAGARFSDGPMRDIRFRPDGTIAVNFRAPRAGPWAVDTAVVDPSAPGTLRAIPHEADDALWTVTYPIHTGSIIGPGGRWIMLLLAAGLLFLSLSGPLQWWRARANRKPRS